MRYNGLATDSVFTRNCTIFADQQYRHRRWIGEWCNRSIMRIDLVTHNQVPDRTKPLRVWIEFDDERSGRELRRQNRALIQRIPGINANWTPIQPITHTIKRGRQSNITVSRTQFPLIPCEAMTVHKSQGDTYDTIAVHLQRMNKAMLYVACSRAKSAQGLYLIGDEFRPPAAPGPENPTAQELARHETVKLIPTSKHLHYERPPGVMQLIFIMFSVFIGTWIRLSMTLFIFRLLYCFLLKHGRSLKTTATSRDLSMSLLLEAAGVNAGDRTALHAISDRTYIMS